MRARLGLAQTLEELERRDEAIPHYRELLRLNSGDNQGVRHTLLAALMLAGRDDETPTLLAQFGDADRALALRPRPGRLPPRGRQPRGARGPRAALRSNRHVPQYLTGDADAARPPDFYRPGTREEAAVCDDRARRRVARDPGRPRLAPSPGPGPPVGQAPAPLTDD